MTHPRHVLAFAGILLAVGAVSLFGQGSLTPPAGTPAPTMRTLNQIYAAVEAAGSGGAADSSEQPLRYDLTPRTTPLGPVPSLAIDQGAALFLEANGADIQGESPYTTLGREKSIHVLAYGASVMVPTSGGTSTGRRTYEPITILKRIDRSTPLLYQALAQSQPVEGELRLYRPNPSGDGTTEHYFTIHFSGGRISRIEQGLPGYDTVSFTFATIRWTHETAGTSFQDSALASP